MVIQRHYIGMRGQCSDSKHTFEGNTLTKHKYERAVRRLKTLTALACSSKKRSKEMEEF